MILVWGPTPADPSPIFSYLELDGSLLQGPPGGAFRTSLRDYLSSVASEESLAAIFSEDWDRYGHRVENPGLYEAFQLADSYAAVLLLPANKSMGVNTWELALACECDEYARSLHLNKLVFVLPRSLALYFDKFFDCAFDDPVKFTFPKEDEEPILGPANSFMARWIALNYIRDRKRLGLPKGKSPPFRYVVYSDTESWDLKPSILLNEFQERLRLAVESIFT